MIIEEILLAKTIEVTLENLKNQGVNLDSDVTQITSQAIKKRFNATANVILERFASYSRQQNLAGLNLADASALVNDNLGFVENLADELFDDVTEAYYYAHKNTCVEKLTKMLVQDALSQNGLAEIVHELPWALHDLTPSQVANFFNSHASLLTEYAFPIAQKHFSYVDNVFGFMTELDNELKPSFNDVLKDNLDAYYQGYVRHHYFDKLSDVVAEVIADEQIDVSKL